MITDCLAPVITPPGVATIVTADSMQCLSEGLTFHQTMFDTFDTTKDQVCYRVVIKHSSKRAARPHRVFITADAMLKTPEGWQTIEEIHHQRFKHKQKESELMVRGYKARCLSCMKLYIPVRPLWSTCGYNCACKAGKRMAMVKPLNQTTVKEALVEDWLIVESLKATKVYEGIQAVRPLVMYEATSLYINGILFASKTLQDNVYYKNNS